MKRTICKEVKYSAEKWKTICTLAAKCGKCPAAYIREKTLRTIIKLYFGSLTMTMFTF